MCIGVFAWKAHPRHPFLLLLNRDEYHNRPTIPLAWWEDDAQILGGRDALAGGTWLACSRNGRLAFVTNVRELIDSSSSQPRSRGQLPVRFLQAQRLERYFKDLMDKYGDGEVPITEMSEKLMKDTTKDDESKLPHIYPLEWEYKLSSIFVDAQTPEGRYGTRSTSVLTVTTSGDMTFYEKHLDTDSWKEQEVGFRILKEKMK